MFLRGILRACLAAAVWLAEGCLGGGGSGSETTVAGVAGRAVDERGIPLEGAAVRIRMEGAYSGRFEPVGNAGEPVAAYTKADGTFLIRGLPEGEYYIECRAPEGAALLPARVKDTLVRLPDAVIRPTGALRGRIPGHEDGNFTGLNAAYVYIPGLPGETFANSEQGDTIRFLLEDVPAGTYTVRVQPGYIHDLPLFRLLDLPDVRIGPGDTTDLGVFRLPPREGMVDSAYLRDSTAWFASLRANGIEGRSVADLSGVLGNRITLLFGFQERFTHFTSDLEALDRVEYANFTADPATRPNNLDASGLGRLRELRILRLGFYTLGGDMVWLKPLRKLERLTLVGAGLTAFPREIEDLPYLYSLDLGGNPLGAVPATVKGMARLRSLALAGTGLASLPAEMAEMRSLARLELNGNGFVTVPDALLRLDGLAALDMRDNQLASLPRRLMAMPGLRGFNVRGNRLCGLSQEWKAWLGYQDSLWYSQADTALYPLPSGTVDSGWEAGQHCGAP